MNEIKLSHNFEHDLTKCIVGMWGLRNGYNFIMESKVYQELQVDSKHRPDVELIRSVYDKHKKQRVAVEVQLQIDPAWRKKIATQYGENAYCIIDLNRLRGKTPAEMDDMINWWLLAATEETKDIKHNENVWKCPDCDRTFKNKYPHVLNCKSNPKNRKEG